MGKRVHQDKYIRDGDERPFGIAKLVLSIINELILKQVIN